MLTSREPMTFSFRNENISEIPIVEIPKGVEILDLSENPIINLKNLPKIPTLTKIICENSLVFSFEGASDERRLSIVSFSGCPITILPFYRVMASVVFGRSVDVVDNVSLSISEMTTRDKYGPIIKRYLLSGYCLLSLEPIYLYNFATRKEKIITAGPIGDKMAGVNVEPVTEDKQIDKIIQEIAEHANVVGDKTYAKSSSRSAKQKTLRYHKNNFDALGIDKQKKTYLPFPPYGYV